MEQHSRNKIKLALLRLASAYIPRKITQTASEIVLPCGTIIIVNIKDIT